MRAVDVIGLKRDGETLSREAIDDFITGLSDGTWADYQVSAMLMAIVLRGMTTQETAWLTDAMVRSGTRVDLSSIPGIKVGKHSTGGVGDKLSIVLAPAIAACGVVVPKMSGRGLGHTGGTLDKLESIPGFRVALSLDEFVTMLRDLGCCMIGTTKDIAPADKTLYALRDVTATIESIPLISASVMSKKLAEGSNAVVLDVKCGSGAFMKTREAAFALARSLVSIGNANGVRTEALITNMDTPLGAAVGNALEVAECVAALRGQGPPDVHQLVVTLGSRMLQLAGKASSDADAAAQIAGVLQNGAALAKFEAMVARQGGDAAVIRDPQRLSRTTHRRLVPARGEGFVARVDAELVGRASVMLGAGRDRLDAPIDLAAGILVKRKPGERVKAGDTVLELHYNDEQRIEAAVPLAESAIDISPAAPPALPLVLAWVHGEGETSYV